MLAQRLLLAATAAATAASAATTMGFATYREILAGEDNSGQLSNTELDRSNTVFLYIQIVAGQDNSDVVDDFRTFTQNYAAENISMIPRVRYGGADGSIIEEPEDSSQVLSDVATWAGLFAEAADVINIPVIQAGFLGTWGEWHSGPLCDDIETKRAIVEGLQAAGPKIALRYPPDHKELFDGDRSVTIHNDCIFASGPSGSDGGTFPENERQTWVDYTREVSKGNTYGGEACNQADSATYDWSDFDDLCGPNGLVAYINYFGISYFNTGNPEEFYQLFNDPNYSDCVAEIEAAIQSYQ